MAFSSFIHPSEGGSIDLVGDPLEVQVTPGDRVNSAVDLQNAFLTISADGFVVGHQDEMLIVPTTPASKDVEMLEGLGWVRGVNVRSHDGGETVVTPEDNAGEANPRIDLLVVRHDPAERAAAPVVLRGTNAADPSPPTPTQDPNGVWETPWAHLHWPAGATALHESEAEAPTGQGWIVDRRRPSEPRTPLGLVVEGLRTTDFNNVTTEQTIGIPGVGAALEAYLHKTRRYRFEAYARAKARTGSDIGAIGRLIVRIDTVNRAFGQTQLYTDSATAGPIIHATGPLWTPGVTRLHEVFLRAECVGGAMDVTGSNTIPMRLYVFDVGPA